MKIKLQEEVVRTLKEMNPVSKPFLSELLRKEEGKLENLRKTLNSIKERVAEVNLTGSVEEACNDSMESIGLEDDQILHQMERALFMMLSLKGKSKYKVRTLKLTIKEENESKDVSLILTPYDTPRDIFKELLREHIEEYPRITKHVFTTPKGKAVPDDVPIQSLRLTLLVERSEQ